MSTIAKLYLPPPVLSKHAHIAGRAANDALVQEAASDLQAYWARLAREFVEWKRPFIKVLDASDAPFFTWFEDGTPAAARQHGSGSVGRGREVAVSRRVPTPKHRVSP
jgi:hypothetical protein